MVNSDLTKSMKRFKEKRLALNLSFQKLADKTGMSKATLQRYESGDIKNLPVDKLKILATALETSPSYLLGWENIDSNPSIHDEAKETLIDFLKSHTITLTACNIAPEKLSEGNYADLSEDILALINILSSKYL